MVETGNDLWERVRKGLQEKLSKPTFETFIRPTGCGGYADGKLKLLAPNPFASLRLREQLLPTIAELASSISGHPVQVTVQAESASASPELLPDLANSGGNISTAPLQEPTSRTHASGQGGSGAPLRPGLRHGFVRRSPGVEMSRRCHRWLQDPAAALATQMRFRPEP